MPVPYRKIKLEYLENSRDIITSKQNRKDEKQENSLPRGIPIIFMILVVAIYTLLNKQGDD
mgnify:CR=1 FL=1